VIDRAAFPREKVRGPGRSIVGRHGALPADHPVHPDGLLVSSRLREPTDGRLDDRGEVRISHTDRVGVRARIEHDLGDGGEGDVDEDACPYSGPNGGVAPASQSRNIVRSSSSRANRIESAPATARRRSRFTTSGAGSTA
jgi:hypothetical protein